MTPLSRYASSPQGDDTLGAGRPFLGVPRIGRAGTESRGRYRYP
ncbi:hypothetical protein C8E07_1999 [Paracidovorax citrulli]|nr:hypothetical protein C8E07_1999 [Paracidovorax citrulli]RLJ93429.1 hypothetical protein C8E06_1999 [Paracidovorax citrulli]